MVIIVLVQIPMRIDIFTPLQRYLIYGTGILSGPGWMIPKAYSLSSSFFHPYFYSLGILPVFGWLVSFLIFKEIITIKSIIEALLCITGSIIIVL